MAEARRFAITPQLDIEQILLEAQHRWLRPAEICEILRNYRNFSIAPEPPNRPPSGSLFLFDRKVLRYFRKDNHNWRKKKDGKTVREAHEMLKAGSVDVLHCYYAHGEENENFQRRSYWMLEEDYTDIVLVHYRDVKLPNTEFGSVASNLEIENDLSLDGKMTYATPLGQLSLDVYSTDEKGLKKYDSFSRWMSSELGEVDDSHINSSSEAYWSSIDSGNVVGDASISNQEQLDTYLVGPSVSSDQLFSIADFSPNWAFAGQETKVLVSGTFLKNKKDVEKCKWSCMFGEIEVPAEVLADGTLLCHAPPHKIGQVPFYITCSNRVACSEVRKFKYRARNKWHTDATDSYITRVNEMDLHIRLEKILSLGSVEHPKLGSGVMKDEQQLVNEINPLTMEGNDEWINTLNQIGEDDFSRENTQQQLHGKLLKGKLHTWLNCRLAEGGKGPSILDKEGQGVLHLAAALGYDWVINPTVTAGVSVNFRDVCGWTAIHWAASCGREKTVATLIGLGAEPGLLTDPTPKFPLGRTPADLASESGHKGISGFLAESSWTSHLNALTLKDSKSSNFAGFSGATGIEDVVERSAIALDYGDMQAGLSLKDSLSAVQKAAQAAARIHQVYGVQSFHRKKLTEYVDQKCDMSDERALSLITLKPNSSGQHDAPVHAAAIRIQNKFRGWKTRKEFLVIQQRIVKIQAHVRGHQVRKQYKKLVWTVGIVEKAILRGRRKGSGLRGFWPERLPDDDGVQNQPWKEDDYDFLQEDRRQSEAILDNELARVKSMVQYPEARDQYRRLLNVVTGLQESKQLESSEDSLRIHSQQLESSEDSLRIHSQFESTMDLTQTSSQQFEGEMEKTQMTYQQSKNSGEQTRERCSVEDSTIYGREDDEKRVIELLLSTDCKDSNVSVIHIFSSAGVGKTTFASLVYNNCRVCEIFETRVWICSTEGLDAMGHAKMIIEALTGISCCLTELVEVQETLKEELVGKRFLLVLDNVCNEDPSFWSSLLAPLSAGAKGSIVIGTSRSNLVSSMALMHSYELKLLSEDNCWSIFQHHAFDRRDHDVKSNRIEIGKQIVSKCGGLPLSVKALGGLLCLANSEKSWSTVLESGLWNTNGTLPALRLSYAHLPVYLKRCFGYCSLFPKGYLFERDHLVHLWLSQGFIEHEEGKQVEDTGNEYIDELLKRSFFQQSPICTIEGKYVMHDLFHDLAQSASVNECFRSESYTFCTTPRSVHHMSLVPRYFDKVLEFEPLRNSKDIRTCLLINRFSLKWDTSVFHIKNSAILDDLFLQCSCLRTLDLGFTNIEALPESIANLKHLCYLGLNKTNIKSLPESICDLCSLQILELQDCSHLDELPKGTKNLATLRHLDVWKESGYILMPPGIGQLTGLQTLSTFHVGRDEQYCGIRELKDMVNLRGTLCIGGLENVINGEEAKEANLRMKAHIQSLTLQWCNSGLDLNIDDSAGAASEVLLNLQANTNLKELIIRNYCGDRFSSWVGDLSFSKLISITLDNCFECDVLPPLGHLPSLKYLAIRMMDVVQSVTHEFLGPVGIISHRFPSLEILKLSEMSELAEWCGVESGDFPHLHSISISRCHKLRRLPSFTSLVELTVHCCTQLPDLPILPCLESLKIEGIQNLKFFPLLPDLPALKVIDIKHCTLLSSVRDLSHLASFERLKVINCPKLHFSPHEKLPSMLQTVEIHRSCPLLKDWCPIGFEEKSDAHQATRKLVRQKELGSEVL